PVASLLAALINVKVVPMLGKPLNYQWLYHSDFLRSQDAHNAILSELSWKLLLIGATAIAGLLAMTHMFSRVLKSLVRRFGSRPLLRAALAVLVLYFVAGGLLLSRLHWPAPSLENPVVSFSHSPVVAHRSPRLLTMTTSVGPDDFGPRQPPSPMLSAIAQRNSGQIRHVVFVVLESVAAEYLDMFGGTRPVTPELDKYAARSALFTNIY